MKRILFIGALAMGIGKAQAQPNKTDSVKPYKEIITSGAITQKGLFTVHHINDKWYFEIADSLLGRDILTVTRYSGTPGGSRLYGGEVANEQTVYWEKSPGNKLMLRVNIYVSSAGDSTQAIARAVRTSSVNPIVAAFDIKAINPDNKNIVIDVTDFFKGDNQVVSLSANSKKNSNLTTLAADRSYIAKISSYPINTEVHTVKTFVATPPTGAGGFFGGATRIPAVTETGVVTFEMNNSFLLLPKEPMRKRLFDPRVGYFADVFTRYDDSSQFARPLQYILHWRMEPREEDLDKFRRGELVEPKKPIVYYIDPATPKKWRKYLIAGINDWQVAFEKAGFKNAIVGKEWPEDDSTMSMEDARFSVIRYFASEIPNAYGPNVHDPRSGEILESHVGWYHNVMKLVHDWYMIQAGAIDPRARKMEFDDSLMGQLIRFVSSHEIGHTLGLRHNMGSSSQTPVEKLRDKAWVEANGHTVSIMDYARFNYVAQPEDHIGEAGIFPRIGAYDKWAIQWGYTPLLQTKNEEEDRKILNKLIVDSLTADPRLWFGGEGGAGEPRSQAEDLGDNAMKAGDYGIKNLQRIIRQLPDWTKEEGDLYENLQRIHAAIVDQFYRYMGHVMKNIGGAYMTIKSVEQKGDVFEPVPKPVLKSAVDFLDRQMFQTPLWLFNDTITRKLVIRKLDAVGQLQDRILGNILNAAVLLQVGEMANLSKDPYTVDNYITDLENAIWKELGQARAIDVYRRHLQKGYLQQLGEVLAPSPPVNLGGFYITQPPATESDVQSIIRVHLFQLNRKIRAALPLTRDQETKYHLEDVSHRINKMLDPNK